jgi:hypothetical protein
MEEGSPEPMSVGYGTRLARELDEDEKCESPNVSISSIFGTRSEFPQLVTI